jgi:DMSO/TMAO reductase YedYZ molybdopterin-dependent catalytic subunit
MSLTRRQFILSATGSVAAAAAISSGISAASEQTPSINGNVSVTHRRSTEITSIDEFYRQQIRTIPAIQQATWALWIGGLVTTPLSLTYQDLHLLPTVDLPCTIACAGNPPGGRWIGHAVWRGVSLNSILERVSANSEARYAHFLCADGYATSLPLERLSAAILAFEMNGRMLPREHGFPVRVIVPGLYGYKMPKWIQKIELRDVPLAGFWEGRGWSETGEVQTTSAIYSPHSNESVSGVVSLSGTAYAGARSVTMVEISVDGGAWMPVPISASMPHRWTGWQIDWTPPAPGEYHIRVRATDNSGFTQSEHASTKPFPDGAGGLHAIVVRVVS